MNELPRTKIRFVGRGMGLNGEGLIIFDQVGHPVAVYVEISYGGPYFLPWHQVEKIQPIKE